MTLFSAYFPLELVVRIWDIYLVEGRKTLFRFSLAIMKVNEDEFLKADMLNLFGIIPNYKDKVDCDILLAVALK